MKVEESNNHRENGRETIGMIPLINPINSPYITWVFIGSQSKGLQLWGLGRFSHHLFSAKQLSTATFDPKKTEDVGFNGGYTRSRTLFGSSQVFGGF